MKKENLFFRKPLEVVCSFLVFLAPLVIAETASFFFWGEPQCPDSLKKLIHTK